MSVTIPTGCDWTATTSDAWLTITDGASGRGTEPSSSKWRTNTGPARTGTISIAGLTHTVNQANGCALSIDLGRRLLQWRRGHGDPCLRCRLRVDGDVKPRWITVRPGASGTGNGTVTFSVARTSAPRAKARSSSGRTRYGGRKPFSHCRDANGK